MEGKTLQEKDERNICAFVPTEKQISITAEKFYSAFWLLYHDAANAPEVDVLPVRVFQPGCHYCPFFYKAHQDARTTSSYPDRNALACFEFRIKEFLSHLYSIIRLLDY